MTKGDLTNGLKYAAAFTAFNNRRCGLPDVEYNDPSAHFSPEPIAMNGSCDWDNSLSG